MRLTGLFTNAAFFIVEKIHCITLPTAGDSRLTKAARTGDIIRVIEHYREMGSVRYFTCKRA